jgi:TonB-linked SusC/RagA family outer membrane protein
MKNCKQRGHNKLLTAITLGAVLLGYSHAMANSNIPESLIEVQQQASFTAKGVVMDVTGEPIIGASVLEKGVSGNGVISDVNGRFTLNVRPGATITVSFIGYLTQEVKAGANMNIMLKEDSKMLDEVEITAEFGVKRVARSIGSSVQNVKAKDIADSGRDNFVSALQGRVSGINVVSSGGAPGSSSTVTLRGISSLSGNNQPLYVVDGVPMTNTSFNPSSGFAIADAYASRALDFSSRGDDFNPEDIESLTVLKGAAAAALYGSDASNGAIIITTKKGAPGKGKVSYSNNFRWDQSYGIPDIQTKYANGAYGATNYYYGARYGGLYPEGTTIYNNLNAILQTGFTQRHNVSIEAGTEKFSLRAAASFNDQTGVIKNTDFKRNNYSISGQAQINDWLRFEGSIQYATYSNTKQKKGVSGSPLYYAMRWPVIDDMSNWLDPDGIHMRYPDRYTDGDVINPLFMMYKNKYYDEGNHIISNATLIFTPVKHTFLRVQVGWDMTNETNEASEHPLWATYNYDVAAGQGGAYNIVKLTQNNPTLNILAGYNNAWLNDKLTFSAQVGYHQLENAYTSLASYGKNYQVMDLISINNTEPSTVTSKKRNTKRRIQAISAQAELGWNNMAFLTLRARNDWSSTLPKDNNSYFYPAIEGSFVTTELPFLKDNKYVNYLKLRGAVAQVGKDARPLAINPELIPTTWTGGGYKYDFTGPNLNLKPEMTTTWEVGVEGRFFNNRVAADFTYYTKKGDDNIVSGFRMSYANGFVLNTQNVGSFKQWGWEAHIDGDVIASGGFNWNIGVNLSKNKSIMLDMPVEAYYDAYTWNSGAIRNGTVIGKPLTAIVGNDFERNDKGEILIAPTTGLPRTSSEVTYLGDREPKLRVGLTTSLSYKGFRLNALFAGKLGATIVNGSLRDMMARGASWQSVEWREKGPVIFQGVLKDGLENTENPTPNTIAVDLDRYSGSTTIYAGGDPWWIQKGIHYLRLQELRLTYNVPSKFLRNFWGGLISSASVYVAGNDLFTITNYTGTDAVGNTVSASAGGVGGEGYDTYALPNPRGISCGVSLTF